MSFVLIFIYHCSSPCFSLCEVEHCHRGKRKEVDLKARKQLIIATVLCTVFMIAEIVGKNFLAEPRCLSLKFLLD